MKNSSQLPPIESVPSGPANCEAESKKQFARSNWFFCIGNFFFGLFMEISTLGKSKTFDYEIDGAAFRLRKGTSDWHVVREVWRWNSYRSTPTGIVVDIGANIGAYAVFAARKADRVFAFEPDPESLDLLRKNLERNDCGNTNVSALAVAGDRGTRILHSGGRNRSATSLYWKMTLKAGVQVEAITLADVFRICDIDRIDVLKIDTEGAEYDILMRSSSDVLAKIDRVEVEYHPVRGESWRRLRDFLKDSGFEVKHEIHWYTPISGIGNLRAKQRKEADSLS